MAVGQIVDAIASRRSSVYSTVGLAPSPSSTWSRPPHELSPTVGRSVDISLVQWSNDIIDVLPAATAATAAGSDGGGELMPVTLNHDAKLLAADSVVTSLHYA